MKKISKEIFTPYLYEENSIRPALEKPFPYNDCIVATDSHVLLMIKNELVEGEFKKPKYHTPNIGKVIPKPNCNLTLTADQISRALSSLEKVEEL